MPVVVDAVASRQHKRFCPNSDRQLTLQDKGAPFPRICGAVLLARTWSTYDAVQLDSSAEGIRRQEFDRASHRKTAQQAFLDHLLSLQAAYPCSSSSLMGGETAHTATHSSSPSFCQE
jgi:hypothetical protein